MPNVMRKWIEFCARNESGLELMAEIARQRFAVDATLDCVEVQETHSPNGSWASWNRQGEVVASGFMGGPVLGTTGYLYKNFKWWDQWRDGHVVGRSNRQEGTETKFDNYYKIPAVAPTNSS